MTDRTYVRTQLLERKPWGEGLMQAAERVQGRWPADPAKVASLLALRLSQATERDRWAALIRAGAGYDPGSESVLPSWYVPGSDRVCWGVDADGPHWGIIPDIMSGDPEERVPAPDVESARMAAECWLLLRLWGREA